ncbi:G1/S-specific cyclin Pcl5 [Metarhizium album ARSEF 1941]|uniref:G1/S-specific cyclin Pcl5 n=1 Tax=Metarhizium album (strain ARSEF 1941) TaxID=1081103 RepID=A0A0B2X144_METAS|nr:G1/S-specific cyclin Pcl5 [Metarhizium album ARSEF 1941]KHN98775.1 G1/S-specific cyclin Pcl5 [Metarhizium album ARSEF 1941]
MRYHADKPAFVASTSQYAPYSSAMSSAASVSTTSVWSDAASQSSDDTSISASTSDSDSADAFCRSKHAATPAQTFASHRSSSHQPDVEAVPPELRQNPRRTTSACRTGRGGCPPALVRQSDRKVNFVDNLVDSSTQIVEAIWPLSSVVCRSELGSKVVLPLRTFIQETLRRSRTSYSTLQVALYYLILIKPHVPKHNFTTEQPVDRHADRALQCGRRMFLAALILASKYLQDRNYSARAWSKISGLNTLEINQNEIAFLVAVKWRLHITDEVFRRWTEIVLKYTPPPSPPSPGAVSHAYARQSADWKQLILKLEPELANIDGLVSTTSASATAGDLCTLSPRSILNHPQETRSSPAVVLDNLNTSSTPTTKLPIVPAVMESSSSCVFTPGRLAPALTLLPTPRLTPQISGFCTPAVSAASHLLGKSNAMGLAMAHVSTFNTTHTTLDRFSCSVTSSPQGYCPARRSSLANSVSTASSPDSMVSDSSGSSRSSSVSSASSLASATLYNSISRCSVPSRFRCAKLWNDRVSLRPSFPSVPEDYDEHCLAASPESCTDPETAKLGDLCLDTPLARRERGLGEMARDPASDAARALQDLHNHNVSADATPTAIAGSKRNRAPSIEDALQENVRDILRRQYESPDPWTPHCVNSRAVASESRLQVPVHPNFGRDTKRVCCSAEAATGYQNASIHPAISLRRPGIWDGILN